MGTMDESAADLRKFLNRIRILHCIDGYEIEAAMQSTGLQMDAERWRRFRTSPADFLVQADDATQRALWSIIERREAPKEPVKAVLI
jgi:hypothetical protein